MMRAAHAAATGRNDEAFDLSKGAVRLQPTNPQLLLLRYQLLVILGRCGAWQARRALSRTGARLRLLRRSTMWNAGPHGYPLAIIAGALPCSLAGGWLRTNRLAR